MTRKTIKQAKGIYEGSLIKIKTKKDSPEKKIIKVEIDFEEGKDPDTHANDMWGKEWIEKIIEITFEDGTSLYLSDKVYK